MTSYFDGLNKCRDAGREYAANGIAAGELEPDESPFSGEWADGLTGQDVLDAAGIDANFRELDDFEQTDIIDYWVDGYYAAYSDYWEDDYYATHSDYADREAD